MINHIYGFGEFSLKKGSGEIFNEVIISNAERLLVYYANEYRERPKSLISSFLKFQSIRSASCLIIFACNKNGILKELEGKNDFKEWVNKQPLEEKWKPVLAKLLLIIWGINQN